MNARCSHQHVANTMLPSLALCTNQRQGGANGSSCGCAYIFKLPKVLRFDSGSHVLMPSGLRLQPIGGSHIITAGSLAHGLRHSRHLSCNDSRLSSHGSLSAIRLRLGNAERAAQLSNNSRAERSLRSTVMPTGAGCGERFEQAYMPCYG